MKILTESNSADRTGYKSNSSSTKTTESDHFINKNFTQQGEFLGANTAGNSKYEVAGKADDGSNLYRIQNSGLLAVEWKSDYVQPNRYESKEHVDKLFEEIQLQGVSDIYISEGTPITIKKNGDLFGITRRTIDNGEASQILSLIVRTSAQAQLNTGVAVNTCFTMFDVDKNKTTTLGQRARVNFRVNASATTIADRSSFQIVMRAIPSEPLHYSKIGLDKEFVHKCCPTNGIVIIAGETGSGKTTTIASIIREILEGDTLIKGNILTHEEPIEFNYDTIFSTHSVVNQSQIPENFKTFMDANREAMRRKPAAVLLGELRDEETIKAALELALTGHPVFGTVHSTQVSTIIQRMVSRFPDAVKSTTCFDLIDCARIYISQRLVKNIRTGKLFGVREYLVFNQALRVELKKLGDPTLINNRITEIMFESDGKGLASLNFAKQADLLLAQGVIDEHGYRHLTE